MVLTHDFRETVQARARREPEYRELLLGGAAECLLAGEIAVARIKMRDYIIATVGFEQLGAVAGKPPEILAEMLGPQGDPSAGDLLEVIACTLRHQGLALQVGTVRAEHDRDGEGRVVAESAAAR